MPQDVAHGKHPNVDGVSGSGMTEWDFDLLRPVGANPDFVTAGRVRNLIGSP
jgi:hypothetical protein